MIREGLVQITKENDFFLIELGQPEWQGGDTTFYFMLEFQAEEIENIRMEAVHHSWAEFPEWPPAVVNSNFVSMGLVNAWPADAFYAKKLSFLKITLLEIGVNFSPAFNFQFVDSEGQLITRVAGVTEYTWKPTPLVGCLPIIPIVGAGILWNYLRRG